MLSAYKNNISKNEQKKTKKQGNKRKENKTI